MYLFAYKSKILKKKLILFFLTTLEILKTDMQSDSVSDHIADSLRFAEALGITGTPTFVLGDEIIPGVIERGTLLEKIAELVPE